MKYLLFFISFSAFGVTGQIKETDLGKANDTTIYYDGSCPGTCWPIEVGQDPEVLKVGDVEVDDIENPIFEAKSNVTADLATLDDCNALIKPIINENDPDNKEDDTVTTYCVFPRFPICNEQPNKKFEAYCTKQIGFEKRMQKQLVIDDVKKAAKDAAKAQQDAQKAADVQELATKLQSIKDLSSASTAAQLKVKLQDLVRFLELKGLAK